MRRPLTIAGAVLATALVAAGPAAAEITVAVARITEGALWVIGQVDQPEAEVILDDAFTEKADRRGSFQFRIIYHPSTCIVRLKSGNDTHEAVVAGCGQAGPPGFGSFTMSRLVMMVNRLSRRAFNNPVTRHWFSMAAR